MTFPEQHATTTVALADTGGALAPPPADVIGRELLRTQYEVLSDYYVQAGLARQNSVNVAMTAMGAVAAIAGFLLSNPLAVLHASVALAICTALTGAFFVSGAATLLHLLAARWAASWYSGCLDGIALRLAHVRSMRELAQVPVFLVNEKLVRDVLPATSGAPWPSVSRRALIRQFCYELVPRTRGDLHEQAMIALNSASGTLLIGIAVSFFRDIVPGTVSTSRVLGIAYQTLWPYPFATLFLALFLVQYCWQSYQTMRDRVLTCVKMRDMLIGNQPEVSRHRKRIAVRHAAARNVTR